MSECPVCYSKTNDFRGYEDCYLSEESGDCPNKCYYYEYTYGSSAVRFDFRGQVVAFYWSYLDNNTGHDTKARNDAIQLVATAARRALLEDLLKLKVASEDCKTTSR